MTEKKIGIIGFGNMGSAIAERLKGRYPILAFDKDKNKTKNLSGIKVTEGVLDLVKQADVVILAVKPQDFDAVLLEIKNNVKDQLIISIAAGIKTTYLEKVLGHAKVIRAMPNMPAKIGKGMSCLCKGNFASDSDLIFSEGLFKYLGDTLALKEDKMNEATAISGSGPGYYFDAVEIRLAEYQKDPDRFNEDMVTRLTNAAQEIGFDNQVARFLASVTIVGSEILMNETRLSAAELKKQITSKGGTTQAALEVLHVGGSLADAVKAAVIRAKELSKKF